MADSKKPEVQVAETGAGTPTASFRALLDAEWSKWVASGPVWVDGALAANRGDALPASHPLIDEWVKDGIAVPAGSLG